MIALLDCNNFYCSCERAADPALNGVPVAVLSSNDGCIIARSQEVKDLGVPMGAPWFKWRRFLQDNQVRVFSANFQMYAEISERVMRLLLSELPGVEVYSIDEAFLDFGPVPPHQYLRFAQHLRQRLLNEVQIPVGIGIGPNKVIAKVANKQAKKQKPEHVVWLATPAAWEPLLHHLPVGDIWGVGRQLARRFQEAGIRTAWELAQVPDTRRDLLHSVVERQLVHELRGEHCKPLELTQDPNRLNQTLLHAANAGRYTTVQHKPKRQVATSRSFAHGITDYEQLAEAVSWFAANAARKLRIERGLAGRMRLYLRTNRFKEDFQHHTAEMVLPLATDYTPDLQRYALRLLQQVFHPHTAYTKGGIELWDLVPAAGWQASLFEAQPDRIRQLRLNSLTDRLWQQYGDGTVYWGRGTSFVPGPSPRQPRPWVPLSQHRNAREVEVSERLAGTAAAIAKPWW